MWYLSVGLGWRLVMSYNGGFWEEDMPYVVIFIGFWESAVYHHVLDTVVAGLFLVLGSRGPFPSLVSLANIRSAPNDDN